MDAIIMKFRTNNWLILFWKLGNFLKNKTVKDKESMITHSWYLIGSLGNKPRTAEEWNYFFCDGPKIDQFWIKLLIFFSARETAKPVLLPRMKSCTNRRYGLVILPLVGQPQPHPLHSQYSWQQVSTTTYYIYP